MDYGVIMHKPSRLFVEAEEKDNSTVGSIRRKIVSKFKDTILWFYKCIVRLQLKYYIQVVIARNLTWKTEESVSKSYRFFDVIEYFYSTLPDIYSEALCFRSPRIIIFTSCEDRLKMCGLNTLGRRRSRRDNL